MKKSILFLACCIGLMFFASCKKDIQPTINVVADPGYVNQGSQVFSGDPILVGFTVAGENLIQITLIAEQDGAAIYTYSEPLENVAAFNFAKSVTLEASGTVSIRGTVTDAKGHTATKSFDISYNEKPNAKFVGHYEGDILLSGVVNIVFMGTPMNDTLENVAFPTIVDIEPGESIIEVLATITIEGQSNTVKGTVDGDKVVFEALNDTFMYNVEGFTVPMNMTYDITGVLNDNQLGIEGTCKGDGGLLGNTIEIDGTLGGSLEKTL